MAARDPSNLSRPSTATAPSVAVTRDGFVFEREVALGWFRLRPLRLPEDVPVVHGWVSREYARYWGLVGRSREQVAQAYREIARHADVFLGLHGDEPAFLVERYRPDRHAVGAHYPVEPGDVGMHVLVAPPARPLPGFTWAVFRAVMDFLFGDPATRRVVVEPDIRNAKIHALNRRAGFRYARPIELPGKTAHLAFCTRADYRAALERASGAGPAAASESSAAHLDPATWTEVNRALIAKAVAELAHERMLEPHPVGSDGELGRFELVTEDAAVGYRFRARRLALDHWDIERASLEKTVDGVPAELCALAFVLEFRAQLGLTAATLPVYLEEITSTLYAAAYKRAHQVWSAADLVHAEFQEIEAAMTEGHPSFVANSGRVGFDAADYVAYAPEAAAPVRLIWLAAHVDRTEVACAAGLSYERLLEEEIGADTLRNFRSALRKQGLDPGSYTFLPVHPWQFWNQLAHVCAADFAARDLVCMGPSEDHYRAQQSIRTFFNVSRPHRRYVKTALSVLNMGFMRGLSADYMRDTPAINDWIAALIAGDPFFARRGFGILREVAGIGYRNSRFEAAAPQGSAYRKMLAALFRESPIPELGPGQRVMTMAALLHRDRDGAALLPQLIQASGLGIDAWLDHYLGCYLAPLLHCFYGYDLAFMPHGENVILVLEDHVPVRALLKDIAEEAVVMDPARELPAQVARLRVTVPEEIKLLSIFTDVFDGIFRYLAQILVEHGYAEERFYGRVAACVHAYRAAQPQLAGKLARYDPFAPEFARSCLNRLQLRNNRQMVDLNDPAAALQFAGTLPNPIAPFRA